MHDEYITGKRVPACKYLKAFHEWKRDPKNSQKNSRDFDKIIGIGEWGWMDIDDERRRSFVIKDSKLFFLAVLKYNII